MGMRRPVEVSRRQEEPSAVDGVPAQEHRPDQGRLGVEIVRGDFGGAIGPSGCYGPQVRGVSWSLLSSLSCSCTSGEGRGCSSRQAVALARRRPASLRFSKTAG